MIITIDGPVASGKSTIARMLAKQLGYYYIYSGLLYRALAYAVLKHNIAIALVTRQELEHIRTMLNYVYYDGREHILLCNADITQSLDTLIIDDATSRMSVHAWVRDIVNKWQQELVQVNYDVIVEGRDSGSVVFPNASIKLYLDAPLIVRAERWREKQYKQGNIYHIAEAITYITQRDERDKTRIIAPLVIPDDALICMNDRDEHTILTELISKITQKINAL